MKNISKITLASSIAFSSILSLNFVNSGDSHIEAETAQTPCYNYEGYAGNDSSFLLDKEFMNGIKFNDLTFNGIKVTSNTGNDSLTKYNQSFSEVSENHKSANLVDFNVKDKLTVQQLKNAYGSSLIKMKTHENSNSIYIYRPNNEISVMFNTNNVNVTDVHIGYGGVDG